MAQEIRSFTITTPINTAKANPLVTSMAMPPRTVRAIEVRVPPGPNGELGFAVGLVSQAIIPFNNGEFIVTSDEVIHWDFETPINSGAWQCISYNTGNYQHVIQVRFYVDIPIGADDTTSAGSPISASDIENATVGSNAVSAVPQ